MDIVIDVVGWTGAVLLLVAYALISRGRLPASGAGFQTLNLLGAAGLTANSAYHHAWPSAALNVIWIMIGLVAVLGQRRRRSRETAG